MFMVGVLLSLVGMWCSLNIFEIFEINILLVRSINVSIAVMIRRWWGRLINCSSIIMEVISIIIGWFIWRFVSISIIATIIYIVYIAMKIVHIDSCLPIIQTLIVFIL